MQPIFMFFSITFACVSIFDIKTYQMYFKSDNYHDYNT